MCLVNKPKAPDPVPVAPPAADVAPLASPEDSSTGSSSATKKPLPGSRKGLRIDLAGAPPSGSGLNIPT